MTTCYINELDTLTKLAEYGGHENIVELVVHQCIPYPLYYIVYDHNAENLQSVLIERRESKKPFPLKVILEIVLQALKAIDFLHDKGIVHRSVTSSAFTFDSPRFTTSNTVLVQLSDLKLARELWKDGEMPRRYIADLQCEDIPTRWSAPESLTRGIFSTHSDYWMFYMFTAELFEHGRWPLTDSHEHSTEAAVTNMLFNGVRIQEQTCTPKQIHMLLLDGTEIKETDRMNLERFQELLVDFHSKLRDETTTDVYNSANVTWKIDSVLPKLSKIQLHFNSVPEKGIPGTIRQYRKTDKDAEDLYNADREIRRSERPSVHRIVQEVDITYIDEPHLFYEEDGVLYIEEKVFENFVSDIWPILPHLNHKALLLTPPWPPALLKSEHTTENDDEFILRYQIPESWTFLEACTHQQFGHTIDDLLELIFKLALLVDSFHEEGWILNCLRAKNIRVTQKNEIFIPRMGRFLHIRSRSTEFHQNIQHEVPTDMKRWLPLETIENNIVSFHSDVYSFGMFLSELCAILTEVGPRYEDDIYEPIVNTFNIVREIELKAAPFGHVHTDQIGTHLKEGNMPRRHECCPEWLYVIMERCWLIQRPDRPTMRDIVELLKPHTKQISKPKLKNQEELYNYQHTTRAGIPVPNNSSTTVDSAQSSEHYSYSTESRTASVRGVTNSNSYVNQTAVKRTSSTLSTGTSTSNSGRIRQKKRTHTSVLHTFDRH